MDKNLNILNINFYKDEKLHIYDSLNELLDEMLQPNLYSLKQYRYQNNNIIAVKVLDDLIKKLQNNQLVDEEDLINRNISFYDIILCGPKKNEKFLSNKQNIDANKFIDETKQEQYNILSSAEINKYLSQNVIFYGAPGCGKSNYVKKLLNQSSQTPKKYFKRVLFYPEYSYYDFVGQVMPQFNGEKGRIEYKFNPGPFVQILKSAIEDPEHEYFLIIEEINRGNAPAIFGDIFQLLDRKYNDSETKGESEYHINNIEIEKVLKSDDVYLPKNLTILATMNTCDQNVFTLDTAFKRRWRMKRIENEFDETDDFKNETFKFGGVEVSWAEFREKVNEEILSHAEDGFNLEDKLLGTHFVNRIDLEDTSAFAEKVIMYLWNDVAKFNRNQFFSDEYKTLDKAISAFEKGENIFSSNSKYLYNYFNTLINDKEEKDVEENQ